ncbi:organic cation/carnitine transporter 2-like [Hemiscyllium ocellatum]|uniref:organic cation/carnitine transporter 2-like n=1 Tax=Hemiscyllium ocellatum TaxID=170820 RepID=UPI00296638BE|nr:organic cation/carnitine transporter 2-like [Hemiscyllium ocellatum]
MRDYDEITAFLGEWGPYQKIIFFLLSLSVFPNAFFGINMVFVGDTPEHRCLIPGNLNLSEAWMNRTIPLEQDKDKLQYSKCRRYRLDVIKNLSEIFPDPDSVNISEVGQEPCLDGWVYSKEQYISTIVSEWDLVCDNGWKGPFSTSVYFIGVLVGSFITGQLADRFGRKKVMFLTLALRTVFGIIQTFSPNWEIFCTFNFLVGLGSISNYMVAIVLGSELVGKSVRIIYATIGIGIFYATGYMFLPFVAYFIRSWEILILTLCLVGFLYIPLWWFIPESPRWLLIKGRVQEAEEIIRQAAKRNDVTTPVMLFSDLELQDMKAKSNQSQAIMHLFTTSNIRTTTILNIIIWMVLATGYFGLSLNVPNLHGDDYLNCFLMGVIEVPAAIAAYIFLQRFPRRFSLSGILFLGGVVLLLIQIIPSNLSVLATVLMVIGKFTATCGFLIVYVYGTELYPTAVRSMGVGLSSTASRAATIISPYVFHLGLYHEFLPFIVLGCLMVLSAILALILPETFKIPLKDTIDQMEKIKSTKVGNNLLLVTPIHANKMAAE